MKEVVFAELEKAIKWITTNSNEVRIKIVSIESHLEIRTFDKSDDPVIIKLYSDGTYPKVTKTERL